MDLIKMKTKLILEQLSYLERKERQDLLDKMNKLMSMEKVDSTIVVGESLSGFNIPYPVKGYFLSEGRPGRRYYHSEDLEKSVLNPKNHRFRLMCDHAKDKASMVIGAVTSIGYDPIKKAIFWSGHLNDEKMARNVDDKVLNQVSVTVYGEEYHGANGLSCRGLLFDELSIVINGADPKNSIIGV